MKMELEFDKEIDALLRKDVSASQAAERAPASGHLDADELAAFAENALPAAARLAYTMHLADCGRCRKTLSGFVSLGSTADDERVHAAAASPAAADFVPRSTRLLAMPNLAYIMGALVLVFAGSIAFLVIQNRNSGSEIEMSQVSPQEPRVSGPNADEETLVMANTMPANTANTFSNANAVSAMPSISRSGVEVGTVNETTSDEVRAPSETDNALAAAPTAGAPAAPLKDEPAAPDRDAKADKEEIAAVAEEQKKRSDDARAIREAPKTGPSRAAGPRQLQQQNVQDSNLASNRAEALSKARSAAPADVRTAGGKKFERRDGVWYDTAYRGQSLKSVRRGTEDYIRLDSSLRSIADGIGGNVVIVWKGTAYRIQ